MKPSTFILALLCGATAGILLFREFFKPVAEPQKLTLEQVLYIKELHLVKHTYNDLFFLHKKNDKRKTIRAMVQVPVTVTAYINLREVKIIHAGDTLQEIILPHAVLNEPHYQTDKMIVRETRAIQVYVGKDLYAQVPNYMQQLVNERIALVCTLAVSNQILVQAEAEGKQYIEGLLATLGYQNVRVTFPGPVPGSRSKPVESLAIKERNVSTSSLQTFLSYGFIPF
jgi:hypothetical protein